ncbi:hypothetical protein [Flavimaricola marinus]|uniref:hypothetical protein n=1 Tax=Flavimaricola marinus TaxID=1819565 RepID=UPI0035222202
MSQLAVPVSWTPTATSFAAGEKANPLAGTAAAAVAANSLLKSRLFMTFLPNRSLNGLLVPGDASTRQKCVTQSQVLPNPIRRSGYHETATS